MAIVEGWDGGVFLGTAASDTLTKISNWKINFVQEVLDNTNFETTTPDRTFAYGLRAHTVEFSGFLENTATGQYSLIDGMLKANTPAVTSMAFLTNKTTGAKAGWRGAILIESLNVDNNVDALVTFAGSGKVSAGLSTFSS
jgi:hypothetical protein